MTLRRTVAVGVAVVAGLALALPARALAIPLPSPPSRLPTIPLPIPTASLLPGILPSASAPIPLISPSPSPAPAATPVGALQPARSGSGLRAATGTAADPPPAPVPAPAATSGSVVNAVAGALPSQVPLLPVLLPVLAGLLLLLVSTIVAAYRRTQEARRFALLERTKSDFMKLASHELRTPLTVLLGYVSMIRDGDIPPDTPAFQKALPIIDDRLHQVNTIVEQMLEAARLEDGHAVLRLEAFDLGELAGQSVVSIRGRAGSAHPVEYRPPARSLRLYSDRIRVAGILDQLLDNAVKYSPEGGPIECVLAESGDRALFSVRDRGIGIAREDQDRIFTRFGRLVTRDNSHIPGTGLGLYLAREHARRMGGDITVQSRPAEGSLFTLALPLSLEQGPDSTENGSRNGSW